MENEVIRFSRFLWLAPKNRDQPRDERRQKRPTEPSKAAGIGAISIRSMAFVIV
jgi:hypothetical protein